MTTEQIDLPDPLRLEACDGLRASHDRLPAEELTPEIEQEIVDTVREVRAEPRKRNDAVEGQNCLSAFNFPAYPQKYRHLLWRSPWMPWGKSFAN